MPIARDGTGATLVTGTGVGTATITFTTTASRHLVVLAGAHSNSASDPRPTSISDSGSGSWTVKSKLATVGAGAGINASFVAYSENRAAITSVTFNFNTSNYFHLKLDQYSGVKSSGSFDVQQDAEGAVSTNAWSSGNLTASDPNCLIVGAAAGDDSANSTWTAPGGSWTETFQYGDTNTNTAAEGVFQIAAGSTGPFSATFTYLGMSAGGYAGVSTLVSFLPSVSGGKTPFIFPLAADERGETSEGTERGEPFSVQRFGRLSRW